MQTLVSDYRELRQITFPKFQGRQRYMWSFETKRPYMPPELEDYLPIVMNLWEASEAGHKKLHVTVDEKVVQAGKSQRRPGPHVDGCFTGSGWGHGWNHYCNNVPILDRMAIIVAASVPGCKAWRGVFQGDPKNDGDCSHFVHGEGEILPANVGYLLSPDCIHESIKFTEKVRRQFLRIAFAA